jgi:ubiquinone/menaquinone biosynthesis C-methylase UbiE
MGKLVQVNLGCGRRVLPDWINVDKKARGVEPDVDADVRELPFENEYADEVMAIHLIEHFYLWEAPGVLMEWKRILKDGGKLILECPDILKAAKFLLEGSKDNYSMWPLYGDPSHMDPLMCHKWGYTPDSLKRLMEFVGFRDISQEPAQFHMKDKRDLRMVGYK